MYEAFQAVASRAALFEIKVRVLADKHPSLARIFNKNLEVVSNALLEFIDRENLAPVEDRDLIAACVVLRNKLFHGEPNRVAGKLVSLDALLQRGAIKKFTLPDGPVTVESFQASIDAGGVPVSDTKLQPGSLYIWLMEAFTSGAFGEAADRFDRAVKVLDAVRDEWVERDLAKHRAGQE